MFIGGPQLRLREPVEMVVLVDGVKVHVARRHVIEGAVRSIDALTRRDFLVVYRRHARRLIEADVERAGADVAEDLIESQTRLRLILVDLTQVAGRARRHRIVKEVKWRSERDVLLRERHGSGSRSRRGVAAGL